MKTHTVDEQDDLVKYLMRDFNVSSLDELRSTDVNAIVASYRKWVKTRRNPEKDTLCIKICGRELQFVKTRTNQLCIYLC